MEQHDLTKYGLLAIFLALLYFSFLTIKPYITYLLASAVLVILFYPVYTWLETHTHKPKTMSIFLVLAIIALVVVPSVFFGIKIFQEAPEAYEQVIQNINTTALETFAYNSFGVELELEGALQESTRTFSNYIFNNIGDVLTEAINISIGLFIMFFVMYYLFTQGPELIEKLKTVTPLPDHHQQTLYKDIYKSIHGIMNGMIIIGLIQGLIGGIIYFSLGVPNALFWALATVLVSIIPVIGAFVIWLPIAAWLFLAGEITKAIILVVLGAAIISQVDNVIRPYVVSKTATIHPALVIVGVFGGLAAFGVIGFIIGPLILALLSTVMSFYKNVTLEGTD